MRSSRSCTSANAKQGHLKGQTPERKGRAGRTRGTREKGLEGTGTEGDGTERGWLDCRVARKGSRRQTAAGQALDNAREGADLGWPRGIRVGMAALILTGVLGSEWTSDGQVTPDTGQRRDRGRGTGQRESDVESQRGVVAMHPSVS